MGRRIGGKRKKQKGAEGVVETFIQTENHDPLRRVAPSWWLCLHVSRQLQPLGSGRASAVTEAAARLDAEASPSQERTRVFPSSPAKKIKIKNYDHSSVSVEAV